MAAVVPGVFAETAALLPIILLGAAGVYYASQENGKAPKPVEKSQEEKLQREIQFEMESTGIDASASQILRHRHVHQGGFASFPEAAGYNLRGGGYNENRNVNPLDEVYEQQQKMMVYDRLHNERGLHFAIPETRPSFKKTPIAAALTEEVHHPDHPMMMTNFANDLQIPSYANERELREAKARMDRHAKNGPSAQNWAEVEFLNRAHGQSFRYEQ